MNAPHEEAVEFAKVSKRENRVYVGNLSYDVKYRDLMEFMRGGGLGNLRLVFRCACVRRRGGRRSESAQGGQKCCSNSGVAGRSFRFSLTDGESEEWLLMGAFFWDASW
jgi:hypothetical protein